MYYYPSVPTVVNKLDVIGLLISPTRTWDDNIKMDLQEVGWEGIGWVYLFQDRERW